MEMIGFSHLVGLMKLIFAQTEHSEAASSQTAQFPQVNHALYRGTFLQSHESSLTYSK